MRRCTVPQFPLLHDPAGTASSSSSTLCYGHGERGWGGDNVHRVTSDLDPHPGRPQQLGQRLNARFVCAHGPAQRRRPI